MGDVCQHLSLLHRLCCVGDVGVQQRSGGSDHDAFFSLWHPHQLASTVGFVRCRQSEPELRGKDSVRLHRLAKLSRILKKSGHSSAAGCRMDEPSRAGRPIKQKPQAPNGSPRLKGKRSINPNQMPRLMYRAAIILGNLEPNLKH